MAQTTADRVTDAMLEDEGRYVHIDGDDGLVDSLGPQLSSRRMPTPTHPAQELAEARAAFLPAAPLPRSVRQSDATVDYDAYDLLLVGHRRRDACGNRVIAREHDYRVLQPR